MRRAKGDHAEKVEMLFREHGAAVHGRVYRLTLDAFAAEDATQEAFVRLLASPPARPFENDVQAITWLQRVAVNCAIDSLRRRSRQQPLNEDHDVAEPRRSETADDECLSDVLRVISPDQRAALLAVDRDDMNYMEAAEMLGISLGKLKSDLIRGRRAMLEKLKHSLNAGSKSGGGNSHESTP